MRELEFRIIITLTLSEGTFADIFSFLTFLKLPLPQYLDLDLDLLLFLFRVDDCDGVGGDGEEDSFKFDGILVFFDFDQYLSLGMIGLSYENNGV